MIRVEPQISQRDIVAKTGFDKSTVSSIVSRFFELGLIVRNRNTSENRPGRPSESLSISPNAGLLVGVQIEAQAIAFVVTGLDGIPLATRQQSFDGQIKGLENIVENGIALTLSDCGRGGPILGVGVSFPGLVSTEGVLLHAPVLNWHDIPIFELLRAKISGPLFLGNDGKAAAMAEHMFGICINEDDFIYLFSGSGVGGALFLEGRMYLGANGLAGELGHMKVVPQGRLCSCGASGCLSAYLSEPALTEEIRSITGQPVFSFREVLRRADRADSAVLDVLENAGQVLGSAISSLINIFNPPLVTLGGDMSRAEAFLRPALERTLRRLAHPSILANTRINFSELSALKPYLGGVALALDGVTGLDGAHVLP
ncbi:MAG: ROK family transcriptional regulator [Verrucomicrobia bacterium]|nr:ROK family transcriptional regulator [Verrucomicrobiota bacterium]